MHNGHDSLTLATGLRSYYGADNPVGLALDGLVADLKKGKLRKKTLKDARAVQALIGPRATAHKIIDRIVMELSA